MQSKLHYLFGISHTKTGTYIVELLDADNSRNISGSYTIDF
jgi:hypothetical protein